jgi:hypothetical protein
VDQEPEDTPTADKPEKFQRAPARDEKLDDTLIQMHDVLTLAA